MTTTLPFVYQVTPLPQVKERLDRFVKEYHVVVLGDILEKSDESLIARYLYTEYPGILVLHPNALLVLLHNSDWCEPAGPRVVVFDHDVSLRFMDKTPDNQLSPDDRLAVVRQYTEQTQCVGVSAGYPSWVVQGEQSAEILGDGALHIGGADSVRCGIIGGVIASMMLAPFEGAHLGSHLFATAGERAKWGYGTSGFGLLASDLPLWIPEAISKVELPEPEIDVV